MAQVIVEQPIHSQNSHTEHAISYWRRDEDGKKTSYLHTSDCSVSHVSFGGASTLKSTEYSTTPFYPVHVFLDWNCSPYWCSSHSQACDQPSIWSRRVATFEISGI